MRASLFALAIAFAITVPFFALAQAPEDLQKSIEDHNKQIEALNKEIAQYQQQLDATSAKKQTLQNTLAQLNLSIKKVTATVDLTKKQIASTQLEIRQLEEGISDKESSIQTNEDGLGESLRRVNEIETRSMALQLLSARSLTAAWKEADTYLTLQNAVREHIVELDNQKKVLTDTKTQREEKQKKLLSQKAQLVTEQGSLNATKKAQNDLLAQTKSQETTYQKIIADKRAQQASFENALNDLQARLNVAISQSDIPAGGKGILSWPLDKVRVTQYFGNTAFAQSGAYNGKGHNGIDLAAPIGTPIKSSMGGTILASGNTDAVRGCYSFGKWVMVKHGNGLNTLYAHLSTVSVSQGQSVARGETLGFSGETGYATGPHLHYAVYVSSATQIMKLGDATVSKTPCAGAVMPIAPKDAYLNPLNYL
jgi:murein DD-endopeptidase MepM/ murein hydrolase activator NlpD